AATTSTDANPSAHRPRAVPTASGADANDAAPGHGSDPAAAGHGRDPAAARTPPRRARAAALRMDRNGAAAGRVGGAAGPRGRRPHRGLPARRLALAAGHRADARPAQ